MLFWSSPSDSLNPRCRLFMTGVLCANLCQLVSHYSLETQSLCLPVRAYVSFFSQNLPCGRARPWASVRRACARLSPLCPLKLCRLKLSSFSRSVSVAFVPFHLLFSSSFHPFLWIPLSFSVLFSLRGSVQGITRLSPVCPNHSPHYPLLLLDALCGPPLLLPPASKPDQRLEDQGPSSLKVWKRDNGLDYLLWLRLTVPLVYSQCERSPLKRRHGRSGPSESGSNGYGCHRMGEEKWDQSKTGTLWKDGRSFSSLFNSVALSVPTQKPPPMPDSCFTAPSATVRTESWMDRLSLTSQP